MVKALVCWIGRTDLNSAKETDERGIGPIARAVRDRELDEVRLLTNYPAGESNDYVKWLKGSTKAKVRLLTAKKLLGREMKSPTHFGDVYEVAVAAVESLRKDVKGEVDLSFHLSPGTSVMTAVWVILGKTRYPATLIQTSREAGLEIASVPFDMSAEFIPDLLRKPDERLAALSAGLPPEAPEFDDIIHRCQAMKELIARTRIVAPRSVPVLIEGETGTGKELLARAIHQSGPRREKPFVTVNCGAIPADLVESQLFGHKRGAFSGAVTDQTGYFKQANGGTILLDEIGELPLPAQVKFLRVLQEGRFFALGDPKEVEVDVRVLAATNRHLPQLITEGKFREDLYHRLAVAILRIPPLRKREGDVGLLVDRLLDQVNRESEGDPGYEKKTLSAGAKNLLVQQPWPGNVRELLNTLRRIAVWTPGEKIGVVDVRESLMPMGLQRGETILARTLGDGLDVEELRSEVAVHYLRRALEEAHGNKSKAASSIGLSNYQTFTNWMKKYGVEG